MRTRPSYRAIALLLLALLIGLVGFLRQQLTPTGSLPAASALKIAEWSLPETPCWTQSDNGFTFNFYGFTDYGEKTLLVYSVINDNRQAVSHVAFGIAGWTPNGPDLEQYPGNLGLYDMEWTNQHGHPGFASLKFTPTFSEFSQGQEDAFLVMVTDFDRNATIALEAKAGQQIGTVQLPVNQPGCIIARDVIAPLYSPLPTPPPLVCAPPAAWVTYTDPTLGITVKHPPDTAFRTEYVEPGRRVIAGIYTTIRPQCVGYGKTCLREMSVNIEFLPNPQKLPLEDFIVSNVAGYGLDGDSNIADIRKYGQQTTVSSRSAIRFATTIDYPKRMYSITGSPYAATTPVTYVAQQDWVLRIDLSSVNAAPPRDLACAQAVQLYDEVVSSLQLTQPLPSTPTMTPTFVATAIATPVTTEEGTPQTTVTAEATVTPVEPGAPTVTATVTPPVAPPTGTATALPTTTPAAPLTRTVSLRIVLDVQPDSIQNFRFHGNVGVFQLDDAGERDHDPFTNTLLSVVTPGTYQIRQETPKTWQLREIVCSTPTAQIQIQEGQVTLTLTTQEAVTCTFVNQRSVTFRTRLYHDADGSGARGAGERWLRDWGMQLYTAEGALLTTKTTTPAGKANFNGLPVGAYTLCGVLPPDWINTQPQGLDAVRKQPCYTVTLPPAKIVTARFGYRSTTAGAAQVAGVDDLVITDMPDVTDDNAGYDDEILIDADESSSDEEISVETASRLFLPLIQQ